MWQQFIDIDGLNYVVINATFNNISVILWRSVYWWKKLEYLEKTIDPLQITDKLIKASKDVKVRLDH
jgi:hypothetical protein